MHIDITSRSKYKYNRSFIWFKMSDRDISIEVNEAEDSGESDSSDSSDENNIQEQVFNINI